MEDACEAAAQAEINNAALYDRLLSTIDNPDVVRVAENLRSASLNNHLPAFEACASGNDNSVPAGGPTGQSGPAWRTSEGATPDTAPREMRGGRSNMATTSTKGAVGRGSATRAYQQGTFRGR